MFWEEQAAGLCHLPETQAFNQRLHRGARLVFPIQPARSRNATPHPWAQALPAPTGATQVNCHLRDTLCHCCDRLSLLMQTTGQGDACSAADPHWERSFLCVLSVLTCISRGEGQ